MVFGQHIKNKMLTIIKPKKIFSWADISELWKFKELLFFLTWRDIKIRYKQTTIGVAWAIIQPVFSMVIMSVVFGKLANMPSDNIPYPIFVYTGLLFWNFFSTALTDTSNILITNKAIVTKIYFPRLILPLSSVLTKFVDFFISSLVLGGLMIYYGFTPDPLSIIVIPILIATTFMASVGGGLLLASVNIKYQDIRYAMPYFMQVLIYITPVIYPASIAGKYSWVLAFNPMTGVINTARATVLGTTPINWLLMGISFFACLALIVAGIIYFKKTERYFADII